MCLPISSPWDRLGRSYLNNLPQHFHPRYPVFRFPSQDLGYSLNPRQLPLQYAYMLTSFAKVAYIYE